VKLAVDVDADLVMVVVVVVVEADLVTVEAGLVIVEVTVLVVYEAKAEPAMIGTRRAKDFMFRKCSWAEQENERILTKASAREETSDARYCGRKIFGHRTFYIFFLLPTFWHPSCIMHHALSMSTF